MGNVSRSERLRRPPKPEFAMTGLLIGVFVCETATLMVEVATGHVSRWITLGGGVAGLALGVAVEGIRYWRQKRRWNAARKL